MTLANVLVWVSIPFVLVTLYFGTQGGYYNTDKYDGDGTAHKVLKQYEKEEVYLEILGSRFRSKGWPNE